jgi:hypothetical protein
VSRTEIYTFLRRCAVLFTIACIDFEYDDLDIVGHTSKHWLGSQYRQHHFSHRALPVSRTAGMGTGRPFIVARYAFFKERKRHLDIDSSSDDISAAIASRPRWAAHQKGYLEFPSTGMQTFVQTNCIYTTEKIRSQHAISIVDNYSHKLSQQNKSSHKSIYQTQRTGNLAFRTFPHPTPNPHPTVHSLRIPLIARLKLDR